MNLNRLMALRKEKSWSLQYVSDQLGMAKSTYAGYESGYRRPSLEAITAMADLFETSVDYILGRIPDPLTHSHQSGLTNEEPIELSTFPDVTLSIDDINLSQDDLCQFVAFIRARREMEQSCPKKDSALSK